MVGFLSFLAADLIQYLPVLIPVLILELVLAITALLHALKHRKFKFGTLAMWIVIVLLVKIIGPILYFTVGREI